MYGLFSFHKTSRFMNSSRNMATEQSYQNYIFLLHKINYNKYPLYAECNCWPIDNGKINEFSYFLRMNVRSSTIIIENWLINRERLDLMDVSEICNYRPSIVIISILLDIIAFFITTIKKIIIVSHKKKMNATRSPNEFPRPHCQSFYSPDY